MINIYIDLKSLPFTWFKVKRHRWIKTSTIIKKEQRNYFIRTSKSIMKLQWNQPKKF